LFLMTYCSTPPAYDGEPDPERLAAAEGARADKRIAYLDEIADMAMELARAQQRKALAQIEAPPEAAGEVRERDAAAGFLAAARAVRVTLLLQARLQSGLNARRIEMVGESRARAETRRRDREIEALSYHGEVEEIVAQVIEREAADRPDLDELTESAREAVFNDWSDDEIGEIPISAVVAKVCKDLGVAVDWSRWEGEDWAVEEAEDGVEGSPFVKAAGGDAPAVNGSGASDVSGAERQATGPP
jgi:hypothetical protein